MDSNPVLSKLLSVPELAETIFSLLSVSELCSARSVCSSWNESILPIMCKKTKSVELGTGLSTKAKAEEARIPSLLAVLKNSPDFQVFTKFHFGHLLNYNKLKDILKTQGPRIVQLTIDCHNDPDDIPAADHHLKFNSENLKYILEKCGSSVEDLRLSLPWEVLELDEDLFSKEAVRYKLWKCKRLLIHNAIFHNYCETQYPPIEKNFWVGFFGICPALDELNIEMDLNPEAVDSFIPMLTAMETSLSSSLNSLSLTVQISNDELDFFAKCNFHLRVLSIKKFHCTATALSLKKLITVHKNTLESLTILIDITYEPNDIEYENFPEPNFGKATLPSSMRKLKYLELSYNDNESIHPNSIDVILSLKFYRIVCLEDFIRLDDKIFLDSMLPTKGALSKHHQIDKIVILVASESEVIHTESVLKRAKLIFPSAKVCFENDHSSSVLTFEIPCK